MARFYASAAPEWWPYQLVSLGNKRLPRQRPGFYHLLIDNGMFNFYTRAGERLPLEKWIAALARFAHDAARLRRPREIVIILPDWLGDPRFTLEAARSPAARLLCERYACAAVAHSGLGSGLRGYQRVAEELASIDWIKWLAAPLKLNCSRHAKGHRVVMKHCQLAVAEQVCGAARAHGLGCHGLGAHLSPSHLVALVKTGMTSFDSSSWTRPINKPAARTAPWSAKTKAEREQYFRMLLERLQDHGIMEEVVADAV